MNKIGKLLFTTAVMMVGSHLLLLILPWYASVLLVAAISIVMKLSIKRAILCGFLALFLLWLGLALYADLGNGQILSSRIAGVFGGIPTILIPLISALIGGIGGILGAYLGASFGKLVRARK